MKLFGSKEKKDDENVAAAAPATTATSTVSTTTSTTATAAAAGADEKTAPAVPGKAKTPALPSKEKKPPPKVPATAGKKPAPAIPGKAGEKDGSGSTGGADSADGKADGKAATDESDEKDEPETPKEAAAKDDGGDKKERAASGKGTKKDNKKSMTMTDTDVLKAQIVNLEAEVERLKKFNADLQKQNDKLSRDAGVAETEQAKAVLLLLTRVSAAKQWMKKVKDLDPLLAALAELRQFQATAPSRVATQKHAARMKEFDAALEKLQALHRAASPPPNDALEKQEQQCANEAQAVRDEFDAVEKLQTADKPRLVALLDKIEAALAPVASSVKTPGEIPPHAITKVVTDFNAYKKDFELTVVPAHDKIAAIVADLEATIPQATRMHGVVEEADGQFNTLFANIKFFVEAQRARQPDPELARLRSHYTAQLADLRTAVKNRAAAALNAQKRVALQDELRDARKALRSKQREVEDLRDDGKLPAGSAAEQKALGEVNALRAALVELERKDAQLAATPGASAAATAAAAPFALVNKRLDEAYTYVALTTGVLKAKAVGGKAECVLKVTQKPSDEQLASKLALLGRLHHPGLARASIAFVDGPHLYVEIPYYAKGSVDQWLATSPLTEQVQRVAFGVLSALAYLHARNSVHGALRASSVLVADDPADALGVRAVVTNYWNANSGGSDTPSTGADEGVPPEGNSPHTAAGDIYAFGALLLRLAGLSLGKDRVLPKIKDKQLASLAPELLDADPAKRATALRALAHSYFQSQFVSFDALKESSKKLREVRDALTPLATNKKGGSTTPLSGVELDKALALVNDRTLFAAPARLALPVASASAASASASASTTTTSKEGDDDATTTTSDALTSQFELFGKALVSALLTRKPTSLPIAPVLFRYLLGAIPVSVRDLLHELELFDPARARHYRHVRLIDDVNELALKMADGSAVTNTNREQYLKTTIAHELVDSRKPALDAVRRGLFSVAGVKDELKKLKASELAVLLAGEDYLSGDLVVRRFAFEPETAAEVPAIEKCVRALPTDELRRVLVAATCLPVLDDGVDKALLGVIAPRTGDSGKAIVSFEPLFHRVNITSGDDVVNELANAIVALDKPL